MPGPIVVPDGFLVTLPWVGPTGTAYRNVLGFNSTGNATHVGTVVAGALSTSLFQIIPSSFGLGYIDTLTLDGSSASVPTILGTPVPGGGGGGDWIPQMCAIVSLKTQFRGPKNRGRVYLGPIPEAHQANGTLDGGSIATMQGAWSAFITAVAGASPPVTFSVVSRKHLSTEPVLSCVVEGQAATQRRRMTQLR